MLCGNPNERNLFNAELPDVGLREANNDNLYLPGKNKASYLQFGGMSKLPTFETGVTSLVTLLRLLLILRHVNRKLWRFTFKEYHQVSQVLKHI